MMKPFDIFGQM